LAGTKGLFDFLVSFVLAEGIDCPDSGGNPAKNGNLQYQADNAGNRVTYGEKGQPVVFHG